MSDVTRVEIEVAACPTPYYHETHRYCPSCPWTEGPLEPPTARELLEEWEAASEVGWSRSLSVGEARIVLAALAEAERERDTLREALRPFAKYRLWQTAKGMRTGSPAFGPKELDAAVEALAVVRVPPATEGASQ